MSAKAEKQVEYAVDFEDRGTHLSGRIDDKGGRYYFCRPCWIENNRAYPLIRQADHSLLCYSCNQSICKPTKQAKVQSHGLGRKDSKAGDGYAPEPVELDPPDFPEPF